MYILHIYVWRGRQVYLRRYLAVSKTFGNVIDVGENRKVTFFLSFLISVKHLLILIVRFEYRS